MRKKILALAVALVLAFPFGLAACAAKTTLKAAQAEYHAELGESFVIPDPIVENGDPDQVTFTVTDGTGAEVTKAQLGSFYPEPGEYTLTYRLGELTATAKIVCSDTVGPTVEYTDYTAVAFEGDEVMIPTFVASDLSGVDEASKSLAMYRDEAHTDEMTTEGTAFTAETGVEAYYFVYRVKDTVGNESVTELVTAVKQNFIDADIDGNTVWDFDEDAYINLIDAPAVTGVQTPDYSIAHDYPDAAAGGGALKLTFAEDGKYAGVRLLRGKTVNTGAISRLTIRLYADNDISIFTVRALREDLADVEFADLEKNAWHELEISPRALYPDPIDLNELEIAFRNTGTTNIYIDEVYAVPFYADETLADGVLADFDEAGYLANIEQAGYDIGKGMISAEYDVVEKEQLSVGALRDGATGAVLSVTAYDLWESDFGGYGVLGDGFKYYLFDEINTAEINKLYLRVFCETGDGLALSFCYRTPDGRIERSKARWLYGTEGAWTTFTVSYEQIVQIVPRLPITDDDGEQITDFDLTAVVITACNNVPDKTPCMKFYVDEISYIGDYPADPDLADGVLADFDESGYIARLDQAWPSETNTAEYSILTEGATGIPAGADGGVVKVVANKVETVTIPEQGSRGDGVRFYLFEPILFDDIYSLTIRVHGAAGKGTALNVGFIINRNGEQIRSNALWEQCSETEWKNIVENKERLALRLQAGDEILAVAVWACGVQTGLTPATEFYIDEISYTVPQPTPSEPVLPANCLIDWTDAGDADRVTQSVKSWAGQQNGEAVINILSRENEANAKIYEYAYFAGNTDRETAFRSFTGSVLEVVSRTSTMDGALVTLSKAFSMDGMTSLDITMFSNTGNGGYVFYIEDSAGTTYTWRIQTTDYTLYTWSKLSLPVATLTEAGLTDIAKISFTYACGVGNASYAYFMPVIFTPAA